MANFYAIFKVIDKVLLNKLLFYLSRKRNNMYAIYEIFVLKKNDNKIHLYDLWLHVQNMWKNL